MKYRSLRREGGYVILLATLMVGSISLATATVLLSRGSDRTKSALVTQQAGQARQLATACAEEAMQTLRANTNYAGTSNLTLGAGSCTYTVVNSGGTARTISSVGTVSSVVRRQQVNATIGTSSITITSWQDTP